MAPDATVSDELTWGRRPKGSGSRKKIVGGAVTPDERKSIHRALMAGGFNSASEAVRKILFAYRDSTAVRDAVAEALRNLKVA